MEQSCYFWNMMLTLFSYVVGIIKLLFIPVLIFRRSKEGYMNVYFLVLLGISGTISTLAAFEVMNGLNSFNTFIPYLLPFAAFVPALYYLFFKNLLFKKPSLKENSIFLGLAMLYILATILFKFSKQVNQIVFFIYSSGLMLFLILLLRRYYKEDKSNSNASKNKPFQIWIIIMIVLATLQYLTANYLSDIHRTAEPGVVLNTFHGYTSILWLFIVSYLLFNPEILYGEKYLLKILNKKMQIAIEIWSNTSLSPIADEDQEVSEKVSPTLEKNLFAIKSYEQKTTVDFNDIPNVKFLAEVLSIPQKHLKFLFKYYSKYTFKEYQNILKINHAIFLINSGYLNRFTLEDLAVKCCFSSRTTFYNNFKKFTGFAPREYKAEAMRTS